MGKAKKNKKPSSDAVYSKKAGTAKPNPFVAATSKKVNPFEIHLNKEKFQILGRTCKHDKGLPGVSRAKAVKKRMATLGQEYSEKHKTNQFRDRRIGKNVVDAELNEEVMNARFLHEKMTQTKKTSRFNLNEDEVLTHRGQTLEEIEQFHDDRSDDEDVEDEGLNAEFTEAAHFGGDAGESLDRKTAIDEMIVEQKRRKAEIAKEKDEINVLTERLDSNYKELMGLVGKMTKSESMAKPAPDDYDKALREMVFEPRGVVADKLQSEEELAMREKERLEQLEKERLRRMRGDDDGQSKPKHRSADDLDDGYFAYGDEEEEGTLAYNMEGKLGTKLNENSGTEKEKQKNGSPEASGEEEVDTDDENTEQEENSGDEEEEEEEDNLSDLKDATESESEDEKEDNVTKENTNNETQKINTKNLESKENPIENTENIDDLPFTIEMPASYEDFIELLKTHTPVQQALIVERLIKCNHPKLEGVNRENVVRLFVYILRYTDELFADASQIDVANNFKILNHLNPHLFDLVHLNPEKMSLVMLKNIKEKYAVYRKNPKVFASLETVVIFKLVSNLYSTSDFRHPVVTPCFIFMQHILSKARVRTRQDVALGLFIVTLVMEYTQHSKRFLPAAFNFLLGMVYICIPKRPIEILKILQPFQSQGPMSKLLAIAADNDKTKEIQEMLLTSEDLVTTTFSLEFKVNALNTTLKLIKEAIEIVSENIGANYLAEPLLDMLERLPLEVYPAFVKRNYEVAKASLQRVAAKRLTKIVPPEKKPKALRLLEPRIETVYDDKRRPKLTKEKEEKVKLLHKIKRETKGAVREIRRDTDFLQKMRIQQQIQSDLERKEKVKRIYQEASVQQGELNEMARAKKKKKF